MAIKIKTDETIEVDVNGKVYEVKIPSLKQLAAFEKKVTSVGGVDAVPVYEQFFASYGLPLEATDKFTLKHWKMLVEELSGTKKG